MTTRFCTGCTRTLAVSMFYTGTNGRIRGRCKQCIADENARRARDPHRVIVRKADPTNLALRAWRGPVEAGALVAAIHPFTNPAPVALENAP